MPARLIPVDGGPAFRLEKPITLIGRHEDCDLALPQQVKISRRHCCIARVDDRFLVRDLGSMNGVRVNGKRVTEAELRPGDELAVADTMFVFQDVSVSSTQPSVVSRRMSDPLEPRMSNPSGDVVLVPASPGSQDWGQVDPGANVGGPPALQGRCDFEAERNGRALSEDLLPTPRMVEPSGRDVGASPLTNQSASDSQSGLKFIGA